jgi:hypothetical protein
LYFSKSAAAIAVHPPAGTFSTSYRPKLTCAFCSTFMNTEGLWLWLQPAFSPNFCEASSFMDA